ncbi:MAG TPA: hypothetical protein VK594_02760, partial [Streptosporangiaceae bacterium]|nr:hypothetical protein [Streptosporangiaceae bacterium]
MPVSGVPAGPGSPAGATTGPAEPAPGAGDRTPPQGRPDRPSPGARRYGRAAVVVLAAAVLFVCYWRQSLTQPISSDGAANALQAWDMLHGNLLLHGWLLSDVSFYTTELPQYMLIEAIRGLGPGVVNLAAAMTYTLLVLLAGLLAKGDAGGREGRARFLLAAGIVLAPQLSTTSTLLQAPDHTGTAVALLAVWLVIDRARPHWLVPVAVCAMLAWVMAADSIVLLTGIVPIAVAAGARAARALAKRAEPDWHELSLAAAAILAGVFGVMAPLIIRAAGGYTTAPVPGHIVGLDRLPGAARVTFHAALNIFGANVVAAHSALELAFAVLHLAGAALAAWAACLAALRFFRARDLLVPAFAVAIAVNLAAFLLTAQALAATREIAAVLPLGAVLAGRLLGPRLLAGKAAARQAAGKALRVPLRPVLAVVAAGYLAALGYGAAQPAVPATSEPLATWLVARGYSHGLAGYWQAGSTTLETGARVSVSSVGHGPGGRVVPGRWETSTLQYDPSRQYADFVVVKNSGT